MIPKTIHYCWYGRGKMSSEIEMCIASWRKYCPDYEIHRWDEDNSPMDIPWVHDAYRHQKYAFVADYVRFFALYHEGGVYMDTDMLLVKPIDEFLKDKAFLGRESACYASMGIIGTEKGDEFAKMSMRLYDNMKFNIAKIPTVPTLITSYLMQYGLTKEDTTQQLTNGLVVYQSDYFYPIHYRNELELYDDVFMAAKENTYGIHLWTLSWSDEITILKRGDYKRGMKGVWQRFKRTPLLPISYWINVVKALFLSTKMGKIYSKYKKVKS